MARCFIIQPFSPKYQKLYADVYKEAIIEAGVDPYKVDEDVSVNTPIEAIEKHITDCDFCFADISEDNPNVWYELGFAMASGKGFCIVCATQQREQLPFDVRHRNVLFYDSESISDFLGLKEKITKRFSTLRDQSQIIRNAEAENSIQPEADPIIDYELSVLGFIAAEQIEESGSASIYSIRQALSNAGYQDVAFALAFQKFERTGLVTAFSEEGFNDYIRACRLTEIGWDILRANEAKLVLKKSGSQARKQSFSQDLDDEIPF